MVSKRILVCWLVWWKQTGFTTVSGAPPFWDKTIDGACVYENAEIGSEIPLTAKPQNYPANITIVYPAEADNMFEIGLNSDGTSIVLWLLDYLCEDTIFYVLKIRLANADGSTSGSTDLTFFLVVLDVNDATPKFDAISVTPVYENGESAGSLYNITAKDCLQKSNFTTSAFVVQLRNSIDPRLR